MQAEMPMLAVEVLANPEKYQGMTIPVNSGYITSADVDQALSKVTGKTIRYIMCLCCYLGTVLLYLRCMCVTSFEA